MVVKSCLYHDIIIYGQFIEYYYLISFLYILQIYMNTYGVWIYMTLNICEEYIWSMNIYGVWIYANTYGVNTDCIYGNIFINNWNLTWALLLGCVVITVILEIAEMLSRVCLSFYIPSSNVSVIQFLYIFPSKQYFR